MKKVSYIVILIFSFLLMNGCSVLKSSNNRSFGTDNKQNVKILEQYGKLPLSFEKNQGQTNEKVLFLSRGPGYTLFLTANEAVLSLGSHQSIMDGMEKSNIASHKPKKTREENAKSEVIRMKLVGINNASKIHGENKLLGTSNYFIGSDASKWHTGIPKYAKVKYSEVYPGIDLVYYGNQRQLEYDFVVSPESDPSKIKINFEGAKDIRLDKNGNLVLRLQDGEVIQRAPTIYQELNGKRVNVDGGYVIDHKGVVGFQVAAWDRKNPLVIDPVIVYSTYLGGVNGDNPVYPTGNAGIDVSSCIAVDQSGNAYVTGWTRSNNFPTVNALYPEIRGHNDLFVTKLSADGSHLIYSTYFGGYNGDYGDSIAVDSAGNAYVTGRTQSPNFPTVNALYPKIRGGEDVFVIKLSPDGSHLFYSTFIGGLQNDYGWAIAVDQSGNAYVTGSSYSSDFPTINALYPERQGLFKGFVFKLSPDGSRLVYSTRFIGDTSSIAVDGAGNAYVTGTTYSSDFPVVNATNSFYSRTTEDDVFISKISPDGSRLVYSTRVGGEGVGEHANDIAVDGAGNVYVTGTTSTLDFPTVNALYPESQGLSDVFVFKLSADASRLVYSTYFGGNSDDHGNSIAVDSAGNAYVTGTTANYVPGTTASPDFPTVNALYPERQRQGYSDVFVFKLSANGRRLVYSTCLGGTDVEGVATGKGVAVDSAGNAYVTGTTNSPNFPVVNALYPNYFGESDSFIIKIGADSTVNPPPYKAKPWIPLLLLED